MRCREQSPSDLHRPARLLPRMASRKAGHWVPTLHEDFSKPPIAYLSPVGHQAGDR